MIVIKDPNAKEKPTTLQDDASIYQKREEKTERQKFHEMKTWSDRANYFRAYYLKPTIAGVCIAALAVYFLYTVLSPKDKSLLRVAFVNYTFAPAVTDDMKAAFLEAAEITLGEHEVMEFDGTTYQLGGYDYNGSAILLTHIMAKEIDIFIAPEATFQGYASNGSIASLTEVLPSDLYSALSDHFFISRTEDDMAADQVLGIYLDMTPFWERYGEGIDSAERPVIGIVANSQHKEMAIDYIRYLFQPISH